MKKKATLLLALALALCLAGCNSFTKEKPAPEGDSGTESAAVFSGGSGTEDDPFLITTADGLAAVADDLAACYRLDADIGLTGVDWTPIGVFTHTGDENADADMPDAADAFSGIFDGGSHTISNLTVDLPQGYAVGLFGCLCNAHVLCFLRTIYACKNCRTWMYRTKILGNVNEALPRIFAFVKTSTFAVKASSRQRQMATFALDLAVERTAIVNATCV